MTPIHITLYGGAFNKIPVRTDDFDTWPELADALEDLVSREYPDKLSMLAFSPHRLVDPERPKRERPYHMLENVAHVTALAIDVDKLEPAALEGLAERVEACGEALMYETSSSTPEAPRVRIVAPIVKPHAVSECRRFRFAFAELLGLAPGCGVEGAIDASKIFFAGRLIGTPARRVWRYGG